RLDLGKGGATDHRKFCAAIYQSTTFRAWACAMTFSVTILGCGSSGGVPRVTQGWGHCDPNEPKNRRRRCSILVRRTGERGQTRVLVDTSPDLREQLIGEQIDLLDGVFITHDHADHTHGIDDLRPLYIHNRRRIDL